MIHIETNHGMYRIIIFSIPKYLLLCFAIHYKYTVEHCQEELAMSKYKISKEIAHMLAVGLYQQAGTYIKENPEDYENFKVDYIAKQNKQTNSNRRQTRKTRKNTSVKTGV